jgi:hypothetical protein
MGELRDAAVAPTQEELTQIRSEIVALFANPNAAQSYLDGARPMQ